MTFLFVERLVDNDIGALIQGQMTIPFDEPYLLKKTDGSSVFLPSLLGEAVGQLTAWSVMKKTNFLLRPVAGIVSAVSMHAEVRPGDKVELKSRIEKLDDTVVAYKGEAWVLGEPVFEIESAVGPLLPMSDFIEKEVVKTQYQQVVEGQFKRVTQTSNLKAWDIAFDSVGEMAENRPVVATKQVRAAAPYFKDHFPQKPVLPLTLLLHCKVQLAMNYVSKFFHDAYRATAVRKVKMSHFVSPGETVSTTMKLKSQDSDSLLFSFRSTTGDKRVCVCEALFEKMG